MKTSKILIVVGLIIVLGLFAFLLFIQISDYRPQKEKKLIVNNLIQKPISDEIKFSVLSWNVGYCGLGKEMDFFYDGGKQVRPSEKLAQKYLTKNLEFIRSLDSIDFWFFQELDKKSRRSYYVDQSEELKNILTGYNSVFAANYKVPFVPMPILKPMGFVSAGMMTFSRFFSDEHLRISYPNIATWPEKLFLLDRCFILFRQPLPSGKDLVLINTHNSYYVSEDSLRMLELNILKNKMLQEYEKGNYVVAGGDWNKFPPQFLKVSQIPTDLLQNDVHCLDFNYLPFEWKFAFSADTPTNRALNTFYEEGKTKISTIDFFVVSPNIKIENCKTFSLGFENSDHNPVKLEFSLIQKSH